MKLIINISDESYDKALNGIINCKECFDAIVYGTPIPDNATNDDVLQIVFKERGYMAIHDRILQWLFAPYQKGGKE